MTCEIVTRFSKLSCSDELCRQISGHVAKLQARGVALDLCLVHVEARHRHHAPGTYHVAEVDLSTAGGSRHRTAHAAHEAAACAIEMAFNALIAGQDGGSPERFHAGDRSPGLTPVPPG